MMEKKKSPPPQKKKKKQKKVRVTMSIINPMQEHRTGPAGEKSKRNDDVPSGKSRVYLRYQSLGTETKCQQNPSGKVWPQIGP